LWELIYRHGPGRGLDDVEFATLTYVDWFNHCRLHGEILEHGYTTRQPSKPTTTVRTSATNPSRLKRTSLHKAGAAHRGRFIFLDLRG
jgi:hypothetical protein